MSENLLPKSDHRALKASSRVSLGRFPRTIQRLRANFFRRKSLTTLFYSIVTLLKKPSYFEDCFALATAFFFCFAAAAFACFCAACLLVAFGDLSPINRTLRCTVTGVNSEAVLLLTIFPQLETNMHLNRRLPPDRIIPGVVKR
jgi:hypothetical protein